jgi:hypothetical protein
MRQRKVSNRKANRWATTAAIISTGFALLLVTFLRHANQTTPQAKQSGAPIVINQTGSGQQSTTTSAKKAEASTRERAAKTYGRLPLQFEANQGQTNSKVKFLSRGSNYTLFLTAAETVLALSKPANGSVKNPAHLPAKFPEKSLPRLIRKRTDALRMKLEGANADPEVMGQDELPGKSNYFIGNDASKWRTNISTYRKVRYRNVYEGVDLVYHGDKNQLEYDFVVAPNADPTKIRLSFKGALKLELDAEGNLSIRTRGGSISQRRPTIYQEVNDTKHSIVGGYQLLGRNDVSFGLGDYDRSQPLVIDPVLVYSTYLGGGADENAAGIAVDANGNAYVSGSTNSVDFPATATFSPTTSFGGVLQDAFVAKLNADGSALVYAAYLGGSAEDDGARIAVDSAGNAYVTGSTKSVDFPTTPGAYQRVLNKGSTANFFDAFVTKLNATGSALIYSTYLGGLFDESGAGIALDSSGQAYVTGATISFNFPVTSGVVQGALDDNVDAFVTKLTADGSSLVYSTFLGGGHGDAGTAIAVDSAGNAYVTGGTTSTDFPTVNAFQPIFGGGPGGANENGGDAFVTKLNPNASAFIYSTYLGGNDSDFGNDIAVDPFGNVYVTGATVSTNFPTTPGAYDRTCGTDGKCNPTCVFIFCGPEADDFVTKLNASGALSYSTYLGGSASDVGQGIAVDSNGSAFVTGYTASDDFPTTPDALAIADNGFFNNNAFVTRLNPSGSALDYSTLIASSSDQLQLFLRQPGGVGIALDPLGNIYCTGNVLSSTFPTTPGALRTTAPGQGDVFVLKIDLSQPTQIFRISGRITASVGGAPISGVLVTLSGSRKATTTTDGSGNYFFDVAQAGNYTLTPLKTNFVFDPYNQSFNSLSADQNANFTATAVPRTFSISGYVFEKDKAGIPGVTLELSRNDQPIGTTLSDSFGQYFFTNLTPGSNYKITPKSQTFTFTPLFQTFTDSRILDKFIGVRTFDIFALVKDSRNIGVTNACVTITDAATNQVIKTICQPQTTMSKLPQEVANLFDPDIALADVVCDANSIYAFTNLPPGTYIVKPASPNYTFSPPSFTIGGGTGGGVFIANPFQTYSVSGHVTDSSGASVAGARVLVCGTRLGKTDTATDGQYSFSTLVVGDNVKVQPALGDMTFSPQWHSFINLSKNEVQDFSSTFNQIDNAQNFVHQHYLDFLSREPDQAGLNYWTSQITNCSADLLCVRNKRVDVSNAFFFELEYQQTGSYVYRLYRAAYGNAQPFPNPDPDLRYPGEATKVPSYAAFAPDRQQVVGGSNLAQKQLDLANAFVQRPEFVNRYATTLDGAGFVDAVLATIKNDVGADLTSQRSVLISLYDQGGRGAVIYRLADDNAQTNPIDNRAFIDAEYNRAFVFTQYAGYLRRNSDIGGFLFWLGQVNSGPLRDDGKQHAMVCSFITSAEYQLRFGSTVTHTNAECPQ